MFVASLKTKGLKMEQVKKGNFKICKNTLTAVKIEEGCKVILKLSTEKVEVLSFNSIELSTGDGLLEDFTASRLVVARLIKRYVTGGDQDKGERAGFIYSKNGEAIVVTEKQAALFGESFFYSANI